MRQNVRLYVFFQSGKTRYTRVCASLKNVESIYFLLKVFLRKAGYLEKKAGQFLEYSTKSKQGRKPKSSTLLFIHIHTDESQQYHLTQDKHERNGGFFVRIQIESVKMCIGNNEGFSCIFSLHLLMGHYTSPIQKSLQYLVD